MMKHRTTHSTGRSAGAPRLAAWMGCLAAVSTVNAAQPPAQAPAQPPAEQPSSLLPFSLTADLVVTKPAAPLTVSASPPFEWIKVRENLYAVSGPDGNVVVQLGPEGALVIDTQRAALGEPLVKELKKLAGAGEIRWLINTNADPGHAGANEAVRNAGSQIVGGMMLMATGTQNLARNAAHLAHENVLLRLSESPSDGAYPNESYASNFYDFSFNGEGIVITHMPSAHTDGDSIVHFRASDVLVAGEVWNTLTYPVIDRARGGSIQGELDALNTLIDLAIPFRKQEGGTMIVPARGRIGDESDVVDYRDMVTIIHDRIKTMVDKKMTLQQVKAAKPTADYDGRYGATSGPWTTDMFIAAVYEGIKAQQSTGDSR